MTEATGLRRSPILAWLKRTAGRAGRAYLRVGGIMGGVIGVIAFVLVWALCIANFGLIFGVALGWIPSLVVAFPISLLLKPGWGPLLVAIVLAATAPQWDRQGRIQHATARATSQGLAWLRTTLTETRQKAADLEAEMRREGLLP